MNHSILTLFHCDGTLVVWGTPYTLVSIVSAVSIVSVYERLNPYAVPLQPPSLRTPEQFERWTQVVAAVQNQLVLARPMVEAVLLQWESVQRPVAPQQVRRAMAGILATLDTPAKSPQRRGKSPGRPLHTVVKRAPRYPVIKKPTGCATRWQKVGSQVASSIDRESTGWSLMWMPLDKSGPTVAPPFMVGGSWPVRSLDDELAPPPGRPQGIAPTRLDTETIPIVW